MTGIGFGSVTRQCSISYLFDTSIENVKHSCPTSWAPIYYGYLFLWIDSILLFEIVDGIWLILKIKNLNRIFIDNGVIPSFFDAA